MFKIDNDTANPIEPLRSADGPNPGGAFDNTLETIVSDEWLNAIQNEIANVVESNGTLLNKSDDTQLFSAIKLILTKMSIANTELLDNPKSILLNDITFGAGLFVAVGDADGVDAYIVTSPDGLTWTERANPVTF
jgi:hypothetical protein